MRTVGVWTALAAHSSLAEGGLEGEGDRLGRMCVAERTEGEGGGDGLWFGLSFLVIRIAGLCGLEATLNKLEIVLRVGGGRVDKTTRPTEQ